MAKEKNNLFDAYSMRARLKPALLVVLPAGVTAIAMFPGIIAVWGILSGLAVWCGGTLLLAQMGRDLGKKKEQLLFSLWGGKPSIRMLRHRDAPNITTLQRRHEKLKKLIVGIAIPASQEESADPSGADDVYNSCITYLRTMTRDAKKFPLLFEENCNYGFRRNLWGMKPIGIGLSVLGAIATSAFIIVEYFGRGRDVSQLLSISFVINLLFLLCWLFWFTPSWVRIPAEAYAERLLEVCDKINSHNTASKMDGRS